MNNVFTFWEGKIPGYIKLCLDTWKVPFTVLNYENLHNYTDLPIEPLQRFTLPQIADCVRVHVLRDQGGYWLDADTIMLSGKLPKVTILGDQETRINTIGMLCADYYPEMFKEWATYQDAVVRDPNCSHHWSVMGNAFTDPYLKEHTEVDIGDIWNCWPETYMVLGTIDRWDKYSKFYFEESHKLSDLRQTDLLMLHNSWTPAWYKKLSAYAVLEYNFTLSNILKEVLI